jgi:hypothetical protein
VVTVTGHCFRALVLPAVLDLRKGMEKTSGIWRMGKEEHDMLALASGVRAVRRQCCRTHEANRRSPRPLLLAEAEAEAAAQSTKGQGQWKNGWARSRRAGGGA